MVKTCRCEIARRLATLQEKAWVGLPAHPASRGVSPLLKMVGKNTVITANNHDLRSHLKNVSTSLGLGWSFRVVSDQDLIGAWLANVAAKGNVLYDKEAIQVSSRVATLPDLVEPPAHLIIRLGVKNARNAAMAEVFHESLTIREQVGKPTWVVEQPDKRLDSTHLCWSEQVDDFLGDWGRVFVNPEAGLSPDISHEVNGVPSAPAHPIPSKSFSILEGEEQQEFRTRSVPLSQGVPDKKGGKGGKGYKGPR